MKQKQNKHNQSLKLPHINSYKSKETHQQPTRPLSTNKINDLSNQLFSQLEEYHQTKPNKQKPHQKKDLDLFVVDLEIPSLKKLEKSMPETYSRLMDTHKSQTQPEKTQIAKTPLSNSHFKKCSPLPLKEAAKSKTLQQKKQQLHSKRKQDSFAVAEREVEEYFAKYLQQQGLTDLQAIQSDDLKELNAELNATESEIDSLRKSMYEMIKTIGNQYTQL